MSSVLSIGGKMNLTARSRHGGRIRSMQSRIAVGSSASASSTAVRQSLGLPREQRCGGECRLVAEAGPPAGRVARPALLEQAARAPAPAVFVTAHQTWSSPWFDRRRIPSAAVGGVGCYVGNFMVALMAINQKFDTS
jgi:hypothetical protein